MRASMAVPTCWRWVWSSSYSTYFWSNCSGLAWPGPPKCSRGREILLFHLGWWNIVIWQDCTLSFGAFYWKHPQGLPFRSILRRDLAVEAREKLLARLCPWDGKGSAKTTHTGQAVVFFECLCQSRYESLVSNPCQKKGNWTSSISKLSKRLQSNSQTYLHLTFPDPAAFIFLGFKFRTFQEPSKSPTAGEERSAGCAGYGLVWTCQFEIAFNQMVWEDLQTWRWEYLGTYPLVQAFLEADFGKMILVSSRFCHHFRIWKVEAKADI